MFKTGMNMRQAATLIASSVIALSIAATAAAWADGPVVTKLPLQVAPVRNLITIEQLSPAIIKELSHTPQDLINLRIPLKDIPLVSEPSRGDLIKATRAENYRGFAIHVFPPVPPPEQPGQMHTYSLNLSNSFTFPADVPDGAVFGIDVSHYEGNIDWPSVANQKIGFAYVKATQGLQYVDDKFQANWKALGDLATASGSTPKSVLLRGAYHFLSADIDPGLQAANFLYHVGPYGVRDSIANIDLPPCIDVEPDLTTAGGDTIDRWDGASHTPDDNIFRIKMFADMVELETGVRPVIYTVASWWNEHLKDKATEC